MFEWLQNTGLAMWINISPWAYPTFLTAHGLGMAVVVGLTAMISLRILGFPGHVSLGGYRGLMPILAGAFCVNAASGALLFVSDAVSLSQNLSFQIKMASVVVGIVVLWAIDRRVLKPAAAAEDAVAVSADGTAALGASGFQVSASAKALALASILIWWLSVIVSGRLVAYLSPGA